jgi:hypothetical protein
MIMGTTAGGGMASTRRVIGAGPLAISVLVLTGCAVSGSGGAGRPERPPVSSGRLLETADFGYTPGADSLGNYKMDPAPAGRLPHLSGAQAIATFERGPFGSTARGPGARVLARFGLFTGWDVKSTNGTMGPLLTFHARPAWLIIVTGLTGVGSGGGPRSGPAGTAPRPAATPASVRAFCVVYDDTGSLKEGMSEMGGTDPVVR